MIKDSDLEPKFSLPPATRSALIICGIFLSGFLLTGFWVTREALRIKRQRDATSVASDPVSGEMVWIAGGRFTMGANDGQADEQPLHDVKVSGFWMDKTEVTNEQFARFVEASGYVTVAERKESSGQTALPPLDQALTGAFVFIPPPNVASLDDSSQWWRNTPGASWRQPEGAASSVRGREKHPVVQVCWEDAVAYAKWAGKRLPSEAEWEYAARGGLDHNPYVWGREKLPEGKWMANIWQGVFPSENAAEDGYPGTAPVGSFPANGFGLFDMAGNVWEWCADGYSPDYYRQSPRQNPQGPDGSLERVKRGGAFLSSDMYSRGYRPSARMKGPPQLALADTGFRCVRSGPTP